MRQNLYLEVFQFQVRVQFSICSLLRLLVLFPVPTLFLLLSRALLIHSNFRRGRREGGGRTEDAVEFENKEIFGADDGCALSALNNPIIYFDK